MIRLFQYGTMQREKRSCQWVPLPRELFCQAGKALQKRIFHNMSSGNPILAGSIRKIPKSFCWSEVYPGAGIFYVSAL